MNKLKTFSKKLLNNLDHIIGPIAVVLFGGVLLFVWLGDAIPDDRKGDITTALATVAVAIATSIYAWLTRQQVNANIKMAEEMRETRYDTIKPIIDINKDTTDNMDRAGQILAAKEGRTDICIGCTLKNIGLGPAIDVYSYTKYSSGEMIRQDHNTLVIGNEIYASLIIEHINDAMELSVYYRDTYGRTLKSRRIVTLNSKTEKFELGNLEIQEISEDELP
jgi:hypothetical protein